jgi:hypothetical protein
MAQDNCPFTRTKKNDLVRFAPKTEREAICFQLHDDLRVLYATTATPDSKVWLEAINSLRMSLDWAKRAQHKPLPLNQPASP